MSHTGSPKSFVGQRDCFPCGSGGFGEVEGWWVGVLCFAINFFNTISDPMLSLGLLGEI